MSDPQKARNDNAEDSAAKEGGQLANSGPIPPEPEDATDSGEGSKTNQVNEN